MDMPRARLIASLDLDELIEGLFLHEVLEGPLRELTDRTWSVATGDAAPSLDDRALEGMELLLRDRDRWDNQFALVRCGSAVGLVELRGGSIRIRAAATTRAALDELVARFRELAPEPPRVEEGKVRFVLWNDGPHGATSRKRRLQVPGWTEVAHNYPEATREGLGRLVDGFVPGRGGKLLLWHGDPGTGKTTAITALAWEWRAWAMFHMVIDPENLFGSSPDYLMDVIASPAQPDRWRVVVMEDTGELLAPDAKLQAGQGLSRLLNVVDGILGRSQRVLVLVTSNEPVERLHPAVSRPGRCASQIRFDLFDAASARRWLAERGCSTDPVGKGRLSLAELFALADGREAPADAPMGFVPTRA